MLYLRVFKTDAPPGVDKVQFNLNFAETATFKYSIETEVTRVLRKAGPVIGLVSGKEKRFFGGPSWLNRLKDDKWQHIVRALMKVSQTVVFVVAGNSNNIKWELHQASQLVPLSRILFYIPKTSSVNEVALFSSLVRKEFGYELNTQGWTGSCFLVFSGNNYSITKSRRLIDFVQKKTNS